MIFIDIFALVGGCLLSICLLPQILKVVKTKDTSTISLAWQITYLLGLIPHLVYGIYYDLVPIYIPTIIELVLLLVLIFLKLNYKTITLEINE